MSWRFRALDNEANLYPQRPQCSSFQAHLVHMLRLSARQTNHSLMVERKRFLLARSAELYYFSIDIHFSFSFYIALRIYF